MINDSTYYGIDFSENPVIQFFFTGSSDCFPAILPLTDVPLDKCPIYSFDLSGGDRELICEGNIRKYLSKLLLEFDDTAIQHTKNLLIVLNKFPIEVATPNHKIIYHRSEDGEEMFEIV
jgi:hypothetical protein